MNDTPKQGHRMDRRAALMTGAAFGFLSACSAPSSIGRTDRNPAEGGIGGTGIVGLVTEFGSLIVNGMRIETSGATSYTTALGFTPGTSVRLGDSLTIEASTKGDRLIAKRVHITHPLMGAVQEISAGGAQLMVNGVAVELEQQVRGLAQVGDRVRVSGLWLGDSVVASRLARDESGVDVIAGEVLRRGSRVSIGGVPIMTPLLGGAPQSGRYATVLGRFTNGALVAQTVTKERFLGAAGPLARLSVEGYLSAIPAAPGYKVAGLGHSFAQALQLAPFEAGRTLFEGPYSGTFEADQAAPLPGDYDARARLLAARRAGAEFDWRATT